MTLEKGQIIKTSYGTGPYEIISIMRNCTCPDYFESLKSVEPPPTKKHIHLTVRDLSDGKLGWLNQYDEETLKSIKCNDQIILLPNKNPIQLTML